MKGRGRTLVDVTTVLLLLAVAGLLVTRLMFEILGWGTEDDVLMLTALLSVSFWSLGLVLLVRVLWKMQDVFTQPLSPEEKSDDSRHNLSRVIRFGYWAMIIALFLSFILFMVPFLWVDAHKISGITPIGVLKGCRANIEGVSGIGDPIACDPHGQQWVLNIGGAVRRAPRATQTLTQPFERIRADVRVARDRGAVVERDLEKLSDRLDGFDYLNSEEDEDLIEAQIAALKKARETLFEELDEKIQSNALRFQGETEPAEALRESLRRIGEDLRSIREQQGDNEAEQQLTALLELLPDRSARDPRDYPQKEMQKDLKKLRAHIQSLKTSVGQVLLDIEATVEEEIKRVKDAPPPDLEIHGGLILPLYIVVFSLFGGAISMTRRLPEYQRRSTTAYKRNFPEEKKRNPYLKQPLEPYAVREAVVFQIMQTLSAPLIAATVYSLIEPSNQASLVVIGFVAGFASEPILIQLRRLGDRFGQIAYDTSEAKLEDRASDQRHGSDQARRRSSQGRERRPREGERRPRTNPETRRAETDGLREGQRRTGRDGRTVQAEGGRGANRRGRIERATIRSGERLRSRGAPLARPGERRRAERARSNDSSPGRQVEMP